MDDLDYEFEPVSLEDLLADCGWGGDGFCELDGSEDCNTCPLRWLLVDIYNDEQG